MTVIESLQNEKIKKITRFLTKNSERKKAEVIIVEGQQENQRAIEFGYTPIEFYICEDIFQGEKPDGNIYLVSNKVYEKIAYRGTTEGIVGLYKEVKTKLSDLKINENSSIIILESVEKPGNLGAILRSCEAFGIEALIVTDPKVDYYNPNVIRSSVGCLFGMKFYAATNEETFNFLENNEVTIFTTFMDESAEVIQNKKLDKKSAVLFGTEHSGLSEFWLEKGSNILIPMVGTIDSLNLSNAVAISCYEILRQKTE